MFGDSPVNSTGFCVAPEAPRVEDEASCQTSALATRSRGSQTTVTKGACHQTDMLLAMRHPPAYDSERLCNFLNRIYPELVEELNSNERCPSNRFDSDREDSPASKLHTIEPSRCGQGKAVSCLSWSSTGMSLAIAYCEAVHESWCTHDGDIHVYSTSKKDFETSPPTYTLNTSSCAKVISFHPSEPSILVAGLESGKVLVWDFQRDDPLLTEVKDADNSQGHSDGINSIAWIDEGPSSAFVTGGKDGKIIIWKIVLSTKTVQVLDRFFISLHHVNPKSHLVSDFAEILSLGFWSNVKTEFVVAARGCGVVHCSTKAAQTLSLMPGFGYPVTFKYESQPGIITCVTCSSPNVFATCGTDSEIRVYKSNEKSPLHVIHSDFPLSGIEWLDDDDAVIAAWGSHPGAHFYRVQTKERLESRSIKLDASNAEVTAARLNRRRKGIVALGTLSGETTVWIMPKCAG